MRPILAGSILVAAAASVTLATSYKPGSNLRIETVTVMETDSRFEMMRDGEPVDFGDRGRERSSEETRRSVVLERVIEASDGVPVKVRREFETLEGATESSFGGREMECPLAGLTLELTLADGEVEVAVVDGDGPDDDEVLEGHRLELAGDGILPEGDVAKGDTWELEDAAVRRLLGLDVEAALFRRSEREGVGIRDGGVGDAGRGPRGGGGSMRFLDDAEWTATAKLVDDAEEHGGETCARIELELASSGDLPERDFEGGGFRGRMFGPRPGPRAPEPRDENTFEVELKGFLLFSLDSKRPVLLEIEGTFATESNTVRDRGDMTMEIHNTREGIFSHRVEISPKDES